MKREDDVLRESMLRYLEGAAPEDEVERLSRLVRTDETARRELAGLVLQDLLLRRIAKEEEFLELAPPDENPPPRRPASLSTTRILRLRSEAAPRWRSRVLPAIAAAALFATALFLATRTTQSPETGTPRTALPRAPESLVTMESSPAPAPAVEQRREDPAPPDPALTPGPSQGSPPLEPRPAKDRPSTAPERRKTPAPPPQNPVAPSASALVAPSEPPFRFWETIIAEIERVQGEVAILSGPVRAPAKVGQNLTWGQGLETGRQGLVVIKYADGTRLQLGSGTVIWEASERPGTRGDEGAKRIHLTAGTLTADVTKQPAGRPMILQTPQGEAKILGTSFKLVIERESTRLEMKDGKIRVTRKDDGATADVGGGYYVVVAKGVPLEVKPMPPPGETVPNKTSGHK